jgi:hypothetical protein
MRQIVLALTLCIAASPFAAFAQTTTTTTHKSAVKKHKVKGHKAPKVKKAKKVVHQGNA